jgi:nucleoside diphosphate kinase
MPPTRFGDSLTETESLFIVQPGAIKHDDDIRKVLREHGFTIDSQMVRSFSKKKAREYFEIPRKIRRHQQNQYKEKMMSGANAKDLGPMPEIPELDQQAIDGLSAGPVILMVLKKERAVPELKDTVGTMAEAAEEVRYDPDTTDPAIIAAWSLRKKFGTEKDCGFMCSESTEFASLQCDFAFDRAGPPPKGDNNDWIKTKFAPPRWEASIQTSEEQILEFVFTPGIQHPNSTGRTFIYGMYGPCDDSLQLHCGQQGMHTINDFEINAMCDTLNREDILKVYNQSGLSPEEEEKILAQAEQWIKYLPQFTQDDVKKLLWPIPRYPNGLMNFHDVQNELAAARERHVLKLKGIMVKVLGAKPLKKSIEYLGSGTLNWGADGKRYAPLPRGKVTARFSEAIAPTTMYEKNVGLTNPDNSRVVSQMLSSHSFKICQVENGNDANFTANIRLLRDFREMSTLDDMPKWDQNCSRRKMNKPHYVKSNNHGAYHNGPAYQVTMVGNEITKNLAAKSFVPPAFSTSQFSQSAPALKNLGASLISPGGSRGRCESGASRGGGGTPKF